MPLEVGTFVSDLVPTNPTAFDPTEQGDDHIRLIKSALKETFPNLTGAMTRTQDQLNRTLMGTAGQITVTNGDGTAGNPTFSFPGAVTFPGSIGVVGNSVFSGNVTANNLFSSRGIGDAASQRVVTVTNGGVGIANPTPAAPLHIGTSTLTSDAAIRFQCGNGNQTRTWQIGTRYGNTDTTLTNYGFYINDISSNIDRLSVSFTTGQTTLNGGGVITRQGVGDTLVIQNAANTTDGGCQVFYNGQNANAYTRVLQTAGSGASFGAFQIINTNYSQLIAEFRQNGTAANLTGTWGSFSDARLKEHVETARPYLDDLNKLRVVKYALKSDNADKANMLGFIAQEIEQVFPNIVDESKGMDGTMYKTVKTSILIPMLVKAVQELSAEVKSLKAERS